VRTETDKDVLGLVGSPNRDGRTYQMVTAALEGAAKAGAQVELIHMADHVVEPCKDCLPWECKDSLKCTYPDVAFDSLSGKLLHCDALVLAGADRRRNSASPAGRRALGEGTGAHAWPA
jgi:multimeric flavodoxin WrbA